MPRSKGGTVARKSHKKVIKAAKGYFSRRKNIFRVAVQAVEKAEQYAYRDRRTKKRNFLRCGSSASMPRRVNSASPMADLSMAWTRPGSRSTARS